jgi:hypothetical protein
MFPMSVEGLEAGMKYLSRWPALIGMTN